MVKEPPAQFCHVMGNDDVGVLVNNCTVTFGEVAMALALMLHDKLAVPKPEQ